MISEHDRVVLTEDVPREGLKAGDVGTIVHIHAGGEAYEVEFICLDGQTVAVVTLKANKFARSKPAKSLTRGSSQASDGLREFDSRWVANYS